MDMADADTPIEALEPCLARLRAAWDARKPDAAITIDLSKSITRPLQVLLLSAVRISPMLRL